MLSIKWFNLSNLGDLHKFHPILIPLDLDPLRVTCECNEQIWFYVYLQFEGGGLLVVEIVKDSFLEGASRLRRLHFPRDGFTKVDSLSVLGATVEDDKSDMGDGKEATEMSEPSTGGTLK